MILSAAVLILTKITSWLFIASLKTLPLIVFVLTVQKIFRKFLSASSRHALWLCVLISLSVPFGWDIQVIPEITRYSPVASSHEQNLPGINTQQILVTEPEMPASKPIVVVENNRTGLQLTYIKKYAHLILACIWLGGVLVFLYWTLAKAFYFQRIKSSAQQPADELLQLFNACQQEMGLNTATHLLMSAKIHSPITLGWIQPGIVLPHNIAQQLNNEAIRHVLMHELGHVKRQDIVINWISCMINIVHWFNPAVWLACRRMRMDMEMACDALVLSHLEQSQRKSYGATLIQVSAIPHVSPRALTTVGILENHSELKERLNTLKEFTMMNIKNTVFFGLLLTITAITAVAQPVQSAVENAFQLTSANETKTEKQAVSITTLHDFAARAEIDLKEKVLVGQDDTDKKFQANINKDTLNYGQFLTQLKINGYTAYKSKDYIQIIELREARNLAIPVVEKSKTYYEDEVVTDYLKTEKLCSGKALVAIRPLIPEYGHLSALDDSRTLIIIDTYQNIQRIKSAINALEDTMDAREDCGNNKLAEAKPTRKNG